MSDNAYSRKKQPEQVRRALLDCAATLAVENGLSAVTLQAVADAAGVTKGGLLHHFASKQILVEAVFADLLAELGREIDGYMTADDEAYGRFTRAYVRAAFADHELGMRSPWAALSVSLIAEPALRQLWSDWLEARLSDHRGTDGAPMLEIVRLAADGVWLADLLQPDTGPRRDLTGLRSHLLSLASGMAVPAA